VVVRVVTWEPQKVIANHGYGRGGGYEWLPISAGCLEATYLPAWRPASRPTCTRNPICDFPAFRTSNELNSFREKKGHFHGEQGCRKDSQDLEE
jgi:hypothetical protein